MDTKTGLTRELLTKDRELNRKLADLAPLANPPWQAIRDLMRQRKDVRAALESLNATK